MMRTETVKVNVVACTGDACCFAGIVLQAQLAGLLSKCKGGAADLEYFLIEAGQLVGLDSAPEAGAKVQMQAAAEWQSHHQSNTVGRGLHVPLMWPPCALLRIHFEAYLEH